MSHLRKRLNEKGFTLLEILIVMAIGSFVLIAALDLLDTNYRTVNNEMDKNEARDNLKIFSSFLIQDLMYSEDVNVYHSDSYDMLHYIGKGNKEFAIKFDYLGGISEMVDGEEKIIVAGERVQKNLPMVRKEGNSIIFNFYATSINATMDLTVRPRVSE